MANNIYGAIGLTGGTAGMLDAIDGAALADKDVAIVVVQAGSVYTYVLNATSGAAESSPGTIQPDANGGDKRWILVKTIYDLTLAKAATGFAIAGGVTPKTLTVDENFTTSAGSALPMGHLSGLTVSHAADTDHDITIAAGKCRDATDAKDMILAAALTKQGDVEWAVGTNAGGMAAGEALPSAGTVHVWLIKRSDTGVVDVMFNNHATTGLTPTLPANYDYKRRIFSLRTVVTTGHFINGDQWGTGLIRTWMYDTPILDYSANPGDANAFTVTLSTPGGIKTRALLTVLNASQRPYWSSLDNTDIAPSATVAPLHSGVVYATQVSVMTNTASQIRGRLESAATTYIVTAGWQDSL